MEAPAVQKEFGPTLPQLLGPRRWRIVWPAAVVVVAVLVAVVLIVRGGGSKGEQLVMVGRGQVQFNYIYTSPPLLKVSANEIRADRDGHFVQSFQVLPLTLPGYEGDVGSILPIVAEKILPRTVPADEYADVIVTDEGRARVNFNPGYYVGWQAKLRSDGNRIVFGRTFMLVPGSSRRELQDPHPLKGAIVQLVSTHAGGAHATRDVGNEGALKKPLRSFRFGTERPR